ncbi:conserved hypothetical protein [Methylobacterium sp. 4-46]|uniref:DUF1868 domain-containing protein n=1 Tax=unclassified Methylobacterium TaxID=2615210 RepID=UPI000152E6E3|nr:MULTISPECIES: DUF1868 domain-containing protein [Methylobacterium]ACA15072.1 conserved hypothetical protein [Methylobacterium sp. 4-46]WFT80808.1 DUF1868 domain-containing protein [Methylobacterium nodulans]
MTRRERRCDGGSRIISRRRILQLSGAAAWGSGPGRPVSAALASSDPAAASRPFPWIGVKFTSRGKLLPCPGNTIVCPIDIDGPAAALMAYRATIAAEPYADKFVFTPPSSYHMTVFEGVVDLVRKPGFWPADLPLDAPLGQCDRVFLEKLETFDLGCAPRFRMKVAEGASNRDVRPGEAIRLIPVDAAEEAKLRGLRDRLSDLLKLRQPGHDTYRFHTTQTYAIAPLTEAEAARYRVVRREAIAALAAALPVLELGPPAFCFFDDMFQFRPRLRLARRRP